MRRVRLWAAAGIAVLMAVGLLVVQQGNVEAKKPAPACTLKTLQGRYLFALHGTLLPPVFGITKPTESDAVGMHFFNGDGTGKDLLTFRLDGQTVFENQVAPFTYTVNPDCTGSLSVKDGPTFGMFIAPDGDSFAEVATAPPGNQVSDIARRVSLK